MKDNQLLLLGLLEVMESSVLENNREVFFNKFYQVRNIKPDSVSEKLVAVYKSLLQTSINEFKKNNGANTLVSSVISLSYSLIPSDKLDNELLNILIDCIDLQDTRIKANALTAIGEFDPYSELFKEHIDSKFNRIAAEALIAEGKKGLNSKIFEKLRAFFTSSNPFFVASGIYAVGQLMGYYYESFKRSENLFQSDFDFFLKKINVFSNHPHEMVRKRALQTKVLIEETHRRHSA
ncbi:MAG: hypothetical protein JNL11_14470 [Bdellovibrionaceae bacterium]|nr:hypothetical protein [Pseudobdellovibrionaceae bacterium]